MGWRGALRASAPVAEDEPGQRGHDDDQTDVGDGLPGDGPASSSARAGPLPMPEARRPWMMGTSVSVAKYMKAPVKLARKFDSSELPPTAHSIQRLGMMPAMAVSP